MTIEVKFYLTRTHYFYTSSSSDSAQIFLLGPLLPFHKSRHDSSFLSELSILSKTLDFGQMKADTHFCAVSQAPGK